MAKAKPKKKLQCKRCEETGATAGLLCVECWDKFYAWTIDSEDVLIDYWLSQDD